MMNRIMIGIVVSILVAGLFGWQRYAIHSLESKLMLANRKAEFLRNNRDELALELKDSEASKQALARELKQQEAVLARRDAAITRSRKELAELSEQLRGLRKTDEEYKLWSDAHVPDAVIRLLRNTRNQSDRED
ncbi:hypothetical protein [Vibrio quintilis]|nr:hypothetical protein [Vibrio quintilis]